MKGEITSYFDVAQVAIWLFWILFTVLIFWIRREDRREGYPLFSEPSNTFKSDDFFFIPPPKVFRLPGGGVAKAPSGTPDRREPNATKVAPWPGAPLEPRGDPMLANVGPGSYAERANVPDHMLDGRPKIVPLRVAKNFACEERDGNPTGYRVIGADGGDGGAITDVWVDQSETIIRYLEMTTGGNRRALIPMTFARINKLRGEVVVKAILASQFANVPALANPDQITMLEEEKVCAYYGAGTLYATPQRAEALL